MLNPRFGQSSKFSFLFKELSRFSDDFEQVWRGKWLQTLLDFAIEGSILIYKPWFIIDLK